MQLGKLEKGDLRKVWKHDAIHFTNWLAKKDPLNILSEELGIEISLIRTEAKIDQFSVDILAEEEHSGRKIIIINQLEATNHDHFGKLITCAAGFDAEIVIWIAEDVRDEQKLAIDWLNTHTDGKVNLVAIELELWKIGDSPYAPKFHIISKPNDWVKAIKKTTDRSSLTNTQLLQSDFWKRFREFAQNTGLKPRLKKSYSQNWYEMSIGYSSAHVSLTFNRQSNQIGCTLYIPNSKDLFYELEVFKNDIHTEVGNELEWSALETKKASSIKLSKSGNITELKKWDTYFAWFVEKADLFQRVFSKYIKKALISSYIRILKFDDTDHIRILKSDNSESL